MLYKENVLATGFEDAVLQKHTLLDHPKKEDSSLRCLCLHLMLGRHFYLYSFYCNFHSFVLLAILDMLMTPNFINEIIAAHIVQM